MSEITKTYRKHIVIKGARVHNLKNIDVAIPRNKITVITGLSGSGKSSLAFDTLYAEGQRRYIESLSSYARQFLGKLEKPDVDSIKGIAPAIAIEQKVNSRNPRSTVGTSTEIYDFLENNGISQLVTSADSLANSLIAGFEKPMNNSKFKETMEQYSQKILLDHINYLNSFIKE